MKKSIALIVAGVSLFSISGVSNATDLQINYDSDIIGIKLLENKELKNLLEKNKHILKKVKINQNYEYNSKHYFTKKILTTETKIPEEIQKRISKIELIVRDNKDNDFLINDLLGNSNAVSAEKYTTAKKVLKINYKPSYSYTYKTSTLTDMEAIETDKLRNHFGVSVLLLLTFDTGDTLSLGGGSIQIENKASILQNRLYDEENQFKDFYANIDGTLITKYLNKKYENISRKAYKEKLEKMYSGIEKLNKSQRQSAKKLYANIKKESDFPNYKEDFERFISTKSLIERLAGAIKSQIKTLEAYDIIDSLED